MTENCSCANPEEYRIIAEEIIEASPAIAIRVTGENGKWVTKFITRNISKFGYDREDFIAGRVTWTDLVHPEDLPGLVASIEDYESRGIYRYNNLYRILAADGREVWVSDDSTVHCNADGSVCYSDCIISDYTETKRHIDQIEDHYRQQRVLKEILLGLQEADVDSAFNTILDSTGVYLDVSRVILFKDDPDHKITRAIHEWCNTGISSMGELVVDYRKELREVDEELRRNGHSVVDFGEIPEHSRAEFDKEGVITAAIFGVFIDGERFGFICFDECVKKRVWPPETLRFLQNIANLVTPAIIRKRNEELRKRVGGDA